MLIVILAFGQAMAWHGHESANAASAPVAEQGGYMHSHSVLDIQPADAGHWLDSESSRAGDGLTGYLNGSVVIVFAILLAVVLLLSPQPASGGKVLIRRIAPVPIRPPRFLRPSPQGPPLSASPI